MKKLLFLILISVFFFETTAFVEADNQASLYFAPASGSFFVNDTFDVSIFVNTGNNNINAVKINIKFDPKKVQVANPTTGKSFIEVWVSQPAYSNTQGTMSFIGGVPSPGINTSAGLVSTVTFRAIAPGETTIFFENSSVHLDDGKGTNILTSISRGTYNLLIPPPEGPKVFSSTHPDQNKWYKNNNPTFSWDKEEGVTEFSYMIDEDSSGIPDNEPEGEKTSVSFSKVSDGILYFHIKAKKNDIWGGTSHYPVKIDNTPPAIFNPLIDPALKTSQKQPLVSFITTDALSGIDHYEIKSINITPGKEEETTGFFTEANSPYKLPALEIGKYLIVVRAFDAAGNSQEGTTKIEIIPEEIFFSGEGFYFKGIIIYWWHLFLFLIIVSIIIVIILWKRHRKIIKKKQDELSEIRTSLEDRRREILNNIDKQE